MATRGADDGVQVEITAELAAYLAAMTRMTQVAEQSAARIQRAFSAINTSIDRHGAPGVTQLRELDVALDRTATNTERAGKRMEQSFTGFGFGSGLQGIAIQMAGFAAIMATMAIGAKSLQTMGDFERDIAMLGAVSESSAAQIAPLREQAIQLGAETSRSATDVAKLQVELGKLGWSLSRIQTSTPGILNLSIAGDMGAGEAAKLVGSTIQQFKLQASAAQDVADMLAQAAIKSAADVRDFATSLDYVGGIAAQYGMTLKDTTAALMTLSDAGFNPSMAATGLRSLIFDFTTPTQHAKAFFNAIKFQARDAQGQVKPLVQLIDEFNAALTKRGMNINTIPYGIIDTNSSAALAAIMQQTTDKVRQNRAALDDAAGAADRLAKVYTQGLQGALERLGGAWDSFSIALGDTGFLVNITGLVSDLADRVDGLADSLRNASRDGQLFGVGGPLDAAFTYLHDLTDGSQSIFGSIGRPGTLGERQRGPRPAPSYMRGAGDAFTTPGQVASGAMMSAASAAFRAGQTKPRPGAPPSMFSMGPTEAEIQRARLLDDILSSQWELADAARMQQDERLFDLQAEVDAYFQISDAKADILNQTARTLEDEAALAKAAGEGAKAYERMRIARDLMAQNPLITAEEAQGLARQMVEAQERTAKAIEDMQRLKRAAAQVGDAFASAFERAIMEGGKLSDVLRGLARDILAITIRTAITEPIGQAIGATITSMFGGGRAIGGPVKAGVAYRVGEAGPELFVPDAPGKIIAAHKFGGGGGVMVTYAPVIDARGADAAAVARLEAGMMQDRAARAVEMRAIVQDALNRRLIR